MKKRTEKECEAEMREIRERLVPIVTASLTIGDYKLGNTIMDCPEVLKLFLENDPTCLLMYETMTPLDPSYGLSIGAFDVYPPERLAAHYSNPHYGSDLVRSELFVVGIGSDGTSYVLNCDNREFYQLSQSWGNDGERDWRHAILNQWKDICEFCDYCEQRHSEFMEYNLKNAPPN